MPFEPGRGKTGGRKPGTPNKVTHELSVLMADKGLNPLEAIQALLPELAPEKQADVHLQLLQYLYPKRKSQDTYSDEDLAILSMIKEIRSKGPGEIYEIKKQLALEVKGEAEESNDEDV